MRRAWDSLDMIRTLPGSPWDHAGSRARPLGLPTDLRPVGERDEVVVQLPQGVGGLLA